MVGVPSNPHPSGGVSSTNIATTGNGNGSLLSGNKRQLPLSSSRMSSNNSNNSNSNNSNNSNSNSNSNTPTKTTHSRSYPRGVGLDFRKLAGLTLMTYIDHHGVSVRAEAPPSELAVAVARHFEAMEVDEDVAVGGFLSRLSAGRELGPLVQDHHTDGHHHNGGTTSSSGGGGQEEPSALATALDPYLLAAAEYARSTAHFDGTAPSAIVRKRRRSKNAARPGEQVAAKVTRTDENGSWILASVQRFFADTETYDVQDEDDSSKLIRLPWNHVMRLSTGAEGCFDKNTKVMAIFPETTSFYRAVVSKQPVWRLAPGSTTPMVKELIVKFEDDEDENGKTPHRRVPSRYVIPLPSAYFHEDDDDVDLTPPSTNGTISTHTNTPSTLLTSL